MKRSSGPVWRCPGNTMVQPIQFRPGSLVRLLKLLALVFSLNACASDGDNLSAFSVASAVGGTLTATPLVEFDRPWAMTFLPDGQLLVTEKEGRLWLVASEMSSTVEQEVAGISGAPMELALPLIRLEVGGLPVISANGQGGLGDVILHPDFENNQQVYISFVEREQSLSGAAVGRATLNRRGSAPELLDWQVIWRQNPKVTGEGHYGHRMAFSSDGYLFITSGERQKFDPAQDMTQNLGKVVRINDDGTIPSGNPFDELGGIASEFWSLGHRNPLGIAFNEKGQLWVHEMGPRGGDELNLIEPGSNYGYPLVSNGRHYSGANIPDHDTRPDLSAPAISWSPVISPSGLVVYTGGRYDGWQGNALIGGLSSQSLVRVKLDTPAIELERFDMGKRIREVEQGPDGYVYVLEDKPGGRLIRLEPQ